MDSQGTLREGQDTERRGLAGDRREGPAGDNKARACRRHRREGISRDNKAIRA